MDHEQLSLSLAKERNKRFLMLLNMGVPFTNAGWTANAAAQFFAVLSDHLTNSRRDRPGGGLEAFLEYVYKNPEVFPLAVIERALVEGLRDNGYREVLAKQFQRLASEIMQSRGNLGLPYRQWLGEFFADLATMKEREQKPEKGWTSRPAWPPSSQILAGGEDLDDDEDEGYDPHPLVES